MGTRLRQPHERLPEYRDLAERFGVRLCVGPPEILCGIPEDYHRTGVVRGDIVPTVHWKLGSQYVDGDRLSTRRGIYGFLKLAHRALNPETAALPKWQRIYEASRAAVAMAEMVGVRVGRPPTELDRSRVKFLLSDPADRDTELKERAWRWTETRYD